MKLRKAAKIGLLSFFLSPFQAWAQGNSYVVDDPLAGDASGSVYLAATPIGPTGSYIWARGDFGERPGVDGNYFSAGAFAPLPLVHDYDLFFVDGQIWISNDADIGGDVGGGYRTRLGTTESAIGVNAFYTWDHTEFVSSYQRFSVGGEWMTNYLGVTANGYFPVSDDIHHISGLAYTGGSYFEGRRLYFNTLQWAEQQLKGADVEIGSPIPRMEWLSVYAGGYFFNSDAAADVNGVSGRISADLTSAVLDLSVQNDDRFGTTVNFGAELRLGGGPVNITPRYRDLRTHMAERVRKRSRVLTQNYLEEGQLAAINPETGVAYQFVHVDNTASAGGSGSDEARYNNLGLATGSAADIILVHRGTSSAVNPLPAGAGLILSDNQMVLGEGIPFLLPVANFSGAVALPSWDVAGASPFVSGNPGVDLITVANNNQIAGLNMIAPAGGHMIRGSNFSDLYVQDINIDLGGGTSGAGGGIFLTNASGTVDLLRFNHHSTGIAGTGGVVVRNVNTDNLELTLRDSALIGGEFGVDIVANNSNIDALLNNVNARDNGSGLRLRGLFEGEIDAKVISSAFDDSQTGHGIAINALASSSVSLEATSTHARRAAQDAVHIEADDSDVMLNLTNSVLIDAGQDALDFSVANGGQLLIATANTMADGAGASAIRGSVTGASSIAEVAGRNFSGANADGDAINLFANDGRLALGLDYTMTGLSFENSGGDGLQFVAQNTATMEIAIQGISPANPISFDDTAPSQRGILGTVTDSTVTLNLRNASIDNAGLQGVYVTTDNSTFTGNLIDSTILNSGGTGVRLDAGNGSVANLTMSGTAVDGAGAHGLYVSADDSQATIALTGGTSFNNADVDAIHLRAVNGADVQATGSGVSGTLAGRDGIHLEADASSMSVNLTNLGSFAGAGQDGVDVRLSNGTHPDQGFFLGLSGTASSKADFSGAQANGLSMRLNNYTGSTVAGEETFVINHADFSDAGDGVPGTPNTDNGFLLISNNSVFNGQVNNSSFDLADQHGWTASIDGGSAMSNLNFTNTTMADAGVDAAHVEASNGAQFTFNITDGDLSGAGNLSLFLAQSGGSVVNWLIDPTPIDSGIFFDLRGASTMNGRIEDSPLTNEGIIGQVIENSIANLTLVNSAINATQGSGLQLSLDQGSDATVAFTNGSTVTGALNDNIDVVAQNGSTVAMTFDASSGIVTDAGVNNMTLAAIGTDSAIHVGFGGAARLVDAATGNGLDALAQDGGSITFTANGITRFNGAGAAGMEATATGAGSTIRFNFNDAVLSDNVGAEGFNLSASDGGAIDVNALGGLRSENAVSHALNINADNGTVEVDASNVRLESQTGHGLSIVSQNGALVDVDLGGVSEIIGNGGSAINALLNGGNAAVHVAGTPGTPANLVGAVGPGVNVEAMNGGQMTLGLNSFVIEEAGAEGLRLIADADGRILGELNNGLIARNNGTGLLAITNPDNSADDGAFIRLNLNGVDIVENVGDGIYLEANHGNNTLGAPPTSGIVFSYTDGAVTGNANGTVGDGIGHGIHAISNGGGTPGDTTIVLNLNQVDVSGNEEDPQILLETFNGGIIDQVIVGGEIQGPVVLVADGAGSTATLTLDGVKILPDNDSAGIVLWALNDGTVTGNFSNLTEALGTELSDFGAQAIAFLAETGGTIDANFTNVDILNNLQNPLLTAPIDDPAFDPTFGVNAAVQGKVTGAGSSATVDFTNVRITDHDKNGFEVLVENGGTFGSEIQDLTLANNTAAAGEGEFEILVTDAGSSATLDINGLTANNSTGKGVNIQATNNSSLSITQFTDVVANGAAEEGLNIIVDGGASLDAPLEIAGTTAGSSSFGSLSGDAVNIEIDNSGSGNDTGISLTNVNVSGEANGVDLQVLGDAGTTATIALDNVDVNSATTGAGVNVSVGGGTAGDVSLANVVANDAGTTGVNIDLNAAEGASAVNLTNVRATGALGGDGLSLGATLGSATSSIDVSIANSNFDNAADDAVNIVLAGPAGSTATIDVNGLVATNAGEDGVDLTLDGGITATVDSFDLVTATNNAENGLNFNILNGSQLTTFAASNLDVSNNSAASTTGAGLSINVLGAGSLADFELTNLLVNNTAASFGKGLNLNVQDAATLNFDIIGGTIANTGREGIALAVGTTTPGATFNGNFSNLSVTNSGIAPLTFANGVDVDVSGAGSSATLNLENVTSNGNGTGDGFNFLADAGAELNLGLTGTTGASNNRGRGLAIHGDGAGTVVNVQSTGIVTDNNGDTTNGPTLNGGHGIDVQLTNAVTADLTLAASSSGNAGDGVRVVANDGTGVTINNLGVTATNVVVNDNGGNGLLIDLDSVVGINSFDLSGMTVSNNVGDQISVRLKDMTLDTVNFSEVTATGPGAGTGIGNGIALTLDGTTVTTALNLSDITATDNGRDGLSLALLNGAVIPAGSAIDIGTFDNNGRHGINLSLNNSDANLSITNSTASLGTISSASNNGGNGINVTLENGSVLTMDAIDHMTINNNVMGINVASQDGMSSFFSGNSITNNTITGNSSFGIRTRFLDGNHLLSIRDNLIDNNANAGIALDMIQAAVAQVEIEDNQITRTQAGSASGYNGEAIMVRMLGTNNPAPATNTLTSGGAEPGLLIQGNLIGVDALGNNLGNTGSGIAFDLEERSVIQGLHVLENEIRNSVTGDGINLVRIDEVEVLDFLIDDNAITHNFGDGIDITAANSSNTLMTIQIGRDDDGLPGVPPAPPTANPRRVNATAWLAGLDGNMITDNGQNGLKFEVQADAQMTINMEENRVERNALDGVVLTEVVQDVNDDRALSGVWDQNVFADNGRYGVNIDGEVLNLNVQDSVIGAVLDQFGDVIVNGNGSTGVRINAPGLSVWDNLDILLNGRIVADDPLVGHGIDIQGRGYKDVTVSNSIIRQNFGDGVEILSSDGGAFRTDVVLHNNRIVSNTGRGVDILNRGVGDLSVQITGDNDPRFGQPMPMSQVSSNGEEGIYIVNTASATQTQDQLSTVPLLADGNPNSIFANPYLEIDIRQTQIANNGNAVLAQLPDNLPGAGVVVRVGTAGGNYSLQGNNTGGNAQAGGFADTAPGVQMVFASNQMNGNFGDDFFAHSYVSTTAPAAATGTWTETEFNMTLPNGSGVGDPLARLDLVWGVGGQTNIFDSIDVNNLDRLGTNNGEAGAFYNDADGTFKSRILDATNPAFGGPFSDAARRRNATRLAARFGFGPTGTTNPNNAPNAFLYPGMGDSTFRVSPLGGGIGLLPADFFVSTGFTVPTTFGELPFQWGTF